MKLTKFYEALPPPNYHFVAQKKGLKRFSSGCRRCGRMILGKGMVFKFANDKARYCNNCWEWHLKDFHKKAHEFFMRKRDD